MIEHYNAEIRARIVNCSRLILDSGGTLDDACKAAKRAGYVGNPDQLELFLKEAGPIVRANYKRGRRKKLKTITGIDSSGNLHTQSTGISANEVRGQEKVGRKQRWAARIAKFAQALEERGMLQSQILSASESSRKKQTTSKSQRTSDTVLEARAQAIIAEAIRKLDELR